MEREASEDRILYTKSELEQIICEAMGGRAAEILFYGETEGLSTGAANDLQQATHLAKEMIFKYGMGQKVKHIMLEASSSPDRELSKALFNEVENIVEEQTHRAINILHQQNVLLKRLAKELLERSRLTRQDIRRICESQ